MAVTSGDVIRLLDVRDEALRVDEVYASVVDRQAGGVGLFVGTVRDHDDGRGVARLEYSAHPTVGVRMREIAESVVARYDAIGLSAVHRIGSLGIGDIAVVAAVSAAHRGQAIDACHALIDDLKSGVPIWKHQLFDDGSDEWVGTP